MKQASVILTFGAMGVVASVMAMGAGPTEAGPADVGAVLRALREKYALPGMVGAIVRGEKLTAPAVAGAVLVAGGIAVAQLPIRRRQPA